MGTLQRGWENPGYNMLFNLRPAATRLKRGMGEDAAEANDHL